MTDGQYEAEFMKLLGSFPNTSPELTESEIISLNSLASNLWDKVYIQLEEVPISTLCGVLQRRMGEGYTMVGDGDDGALCLSKPRKPTLDDFRNHLKISRRFEWFSISHNNVVRSNAVKRYLNISGQPEKTKQLDDHHSKCTESLNHVIFNIPEQITELLHIENT